MSLQVIAGPRGDILWVSGALRGSVHDKKAEWMWGVLAELEAPGLVTFADKGYQESTYAKIPCKGKNKPDSLTKLRCCPWRAGQLAKAIHVLQLCEA